MKTYFLMHKDICVAKLMEASGQFKVEKLYNEKHMPIGTQNPYDNNLSRAVNTWNKSRTIPSERPNLDKLLQKVGVGKTEELVEKDYLCSLTDCYWFKPENDLATWKDVNYFDNGFDSNVCDVLFYGNEATIINNFHSPDITTNGALSKMWIQDKKGEFYLIKDSFRDKNRPNNCDEVCGEIFAYQVAKILGIDAVPYFFLNENSTGKTYSICPNFVKSDKFEFVTMEQYRNDMGRKTKSSYEYFCKLGFKDKIDAIIGLDFLIANGDRHQGNICLLRNPDTLEIIDLAPCFDNGACLPYDHINKKSHRNIWFKNGKQKRI